MDELIGPNVQIVLGVIEGQGFDFTNDPVYVTGSLNGHVLETDSVGPCSSPIFGTNLIWQADKKGLRLMRTGNIPMKVECYSINYQNRKERIGYIILSLRAIQIIPTGKTCTIHQSWNKLMGVKNEAKAFRPELLLSFYVEDDTKKINEEPCCPSITKLDSTVNLSVSSGTWRHPTIVPRLCSEEGLIQIGPEETCSDIFLLSILIGTATNLDMLLRENSKEVNNYSFCYTIFGHSIRTKPFYRNLQQPCALNEKIVLRLRSSLKILNIYFTEVSLINLKLFGEQEEIGCANMELKNLVPTEKLTEFFTRYAVNNTVTQNGKCYLFSSLTGETPMDERGRKPYINVEIKLKYLPPSKITTRRSPMQEVPRNVPSSSNQVTARSTTELVENDGVQEEVPLRSTSLTGLEPKAVSSCYQEPTPRVALEAGDYKTELTSDIFNDIPPKKHDKQFISVSTGNIPNKEAVTNNQTSKSSPILQFSSSLSSPRNVKNVEAYHRYGLNVILESVAFSRVIKQKIIFRFHHPKAEVIYSSHPEISIDKINETVHLHDVKCQVNFVSTSEEIGRLLLAWPPKISICENQKDLPVLLGETLLDTSLLFQQNEKCSYIAQLCEPITGSEFAQIKISMYLEDYGVKLNKEQDSDYVLGPPILDERIAYKLIEELEDWKEKQQEMFKAELEQKEEARLTLLSDEWNARRAELEAKLCRGVEKCRILAANLSRTTEEQRLKATKHLEAENKFKRLKEELEQSYRIKQQDLRDAIRKVEDEYNQKINEIKSENFELIGKLNALERENALLKDTIKTHEVELKELRKTSLTKEQVASLLQEVKSLEEKLEASMKSKAFFKEEWGKTVREIHRMKSEYQKQLQNQIRINKEELSTLELKDFLNKEDLQLKSDREALSKIRSDLNFLAKEQMGINHDEYYTTSRPDLLDMNLDEKTAMLIEERDALLRTGSYNEQDPVIMKLNEELQSIKSQSNVLL